MAEKRMLQAETELKDVRKSSSYSASYDETCNNVEKLIAGYTTEDYASLLSLADALEDYEYPVEIRVITERPFFHFKTNRKELTAAILAEKEKSSVA